MYSDKKQRTTLSHYFILIGSLLFLSLLFLGSDCQESLPQYAEPADVYSAEISFPVGNPDNIRMDIVRVLGGISPLTFSIQLYNTYDETISGEIPQSLGKIEIWWNDDPNIKRTLDITPLNESKTNIFRPYLPVAFDPGDSAVFAINWYDWQDNRGTNLWDYVADGEKTTSSNGTVYSNKNPMTFSAQAALTPIQFGPTVYTEEIQFTVTFYTR